MSHTPGPWKVCSSGDGVESKSGDICCVYESDGLDCPTKMPYKANALLIAAAPELLETCRELRQIIVCGMTADPDEMIDALKRSRVAIAKAEGRS
jgi:hypothetical protein